MESNHTLTVLQRLVDLDGPEGLRLGEPKTSGPLTLIPVEHTMAPARYQLFSTLAAGELVRVSEVSSSGTVPELVVENKANVAVLLVEGEILTGMKQTRVLNTTVLVPAKSKTVIPVSCLERGRWSAMSDFATRDDYLASPSLRSITAFSVQANVRRSGEFRSDQGSVWSEVEERLGRHRVDSETSSYADVHRRRRREIEGFLSDLKPNPDQTGVLVVVGGAPVALDVFDRPSTLEALWPGLVGSYAADALAADISETSDEVEAARGWLLGLPGAAVTVHDAVGLGQVVQLTGEMVIGSALVVEDSIVHLAAFGRGRRPFFRPDFVPSTPAQRRDRMGRDRVERDRVDSEVQ